MPYYPVLLDLRDKRVLFVGGGWETEAKVKGLLAVGARVTLISPLEHKGLEPLALEGRIHWLRRGYRRGDLAGFSLVISHPSDKSLNARIAQEARERGVWLNAVDDPAHCDFILPAVHRQGELVIAVSTGGAAPALGVRIKQRLAREFGPEYAEYLRLLRSLRAVVQQTYPQDFEARKAAWYRMVDSPALERVARGDLEGAREVLLAALRHGPEAEVAW
ncbi:MULTISPECIES: bifunctional precorrin-2 dehydrogenase/sirohydrochlorin ferrochelatase [unclassified Meiothermus]|uniref:precorrin-2 dehydrogenase/sirohydrochlorin ferrochelatase family protein n=1 Tax=unclassified Meiothermus TaxID=370471 RepID=UPI000D7BC8AE|nr:MULTISPECIES: bifunctional precorrin-2 dehydrogenase/sirohydrochlorin ferrochelatase [unclassified Meiothermus]PZA07686.1 bifunctional precorrin-2 dehydrogenase/sirohydrochlorin ferrochelatase [Meiothermus sp. Pnk-1]RYM36523.1 bifunctional precorrin-2 dehydrogenase/sirohydrochlorin ferrochelatase [Meiothermus sp. PNK-Is4]